MMWDADRLKTVALRYVRYCGVTFVMFVFDLIIVYFLYFHFGFGYISSTAIGFLIAITGAFFLNREFTFYTHTQLWRIIYAIGVALVSLIMITYLTYVGVEYWALHYLIARSIAAAISNVFSYIADSLVTFQVKPFE